MLNNKQKMKKYNDAFANFKDLISKKHKEYKKKKLENPREEVIELKKRNKKVFWKSLGFIGMFFLSGMVLNCLIFYFLDDFRNPYLRESENLFGFIDALIKYGSIEEICVMLFFVSFFSFTPVIILNDYFKEYNINFKTKKNLVLNEEKFKLNYILNKEELEKEYKRIEQIINKEELQEIMFKVNKRLNDDTVDIGSSIFIENVYKELKLKIEEENNKMKMVINKKLNYVLK